MMYGDMEQEQQDGERLADCRTRKHPEWAWLIRNSVLFESRTLLPGAHGTESINTDPLWVKMSLTVPSVIRIGRGGGKLGPGSRYVGFSGSAS
jgi:hypothetical protein